MIGYIVQETKHGRFMQHANEEQKQQMEADEEEQQRYWLVKSSFQHLTVWQHDFKPTMREDAYLRAMAYLEVADALHDTTVD